jgi:PEP-CTERM motif
MQKIMGFRSRSLVMALAATMAPFAPVAAKEASYDVTHRMTIQPNLGFGGEWQAGWRYIVGQVVATYDRAKDEPETIKGQIEPFNGAGSPKNLSAAIGASSAFGESGATASFTSGSMAFNGTINVNGTATTNPPPGHSGSAFASSQSLLIAGLKRTSSSGHVSWNSVTSIRAVNCTSPCVAGKDPISFTLVDPVTSDIVAGTLLAIDLSIERGDGQIDWRDGILSVSTLSLLSGSFSIDQSSRFVTNPGTLNLTFVNNIITHSAATGIYAGLAPAVGRSAIGSFNFGEQDVGYDFGHGDIPIAVDFGFGNSGDATVAAVPEPSAWLMAMVGLGVTGGVMRRQKQTTRELA